MKELSKITETFTESVIREMTRQNDAIGGINLSQGFPDFESPPAIREAAIRAITAHHNQYPVTFGEKNLREAISRKALAYNKIHYDPTDGITVTCGATEAMIATLMALINPGDEVIIFEPFYENYSADVILSGATPRYVKLNPPDWHYDDSDLEKAFSEKTKAIIINTPNNPTGKVYSREELTRIAALCQKWDAYAVTDEIYEHILYDVHEHISMASLPGMEERTVTINSISKTYAVTGWRVGWAIAAPLITQRIRKVHDFLTVGAPNPFQQAAAEALDFPQEYYLAMQQKYLHARNHLFETLQEAGFTPYLPSGAYYILADAGNLFDKLQATDDYDFSIRLLKTTKIATVPGSSFFHEDQKATRMVRFAFCKKMETLEKVRNAFVSFE
ncbi:MAG: pyridoxal phosphate-dependent aminotransferase [Bacteroidetes bacterium]|nr:pyridoxal phosphate-dependent aminotransferase [Bacteroidota bacterium]